MNTSQRSTVSREQAEAVLADVKRVFAAWQAPGGDAFEPWLNMEWSWPGESTPTVIWEGGPYNWTLLYPHGGIEEEFGFRLAPGQLPEGVVTEPYSGWALCLYPEVAR